MTEKTLAYRIARLESRRQPSQRVQVCWGDCTGPCPLCNPEAGAHAGLVITWPDEAPDYDD